ncbi:MAG: Na+/H+ antiporter [Chloroflexota bacterium]|nr:Na+/H+ antiporter [Chloroflexota bacterium]
MPEETNLSLVTLIELLLVVLAVAVLVKRVRIPYTVALVLAGLVVGLLPQLSGVNLTPELILTIFLPVLLFEGAYNLPAHRLRRNLAPVALLAVPGVLLSTGATAALVHWALGLDWRVAFLFGTLISATDPVSVLALFRQLGAPHRLATIVEGESLFNDGMAFVLFQIVLASIVSGAFSPVEGLRDFVVSLAGALAIGSVIGFGGSLILRAIDDYLLEVTATFVAAYGAFLLAERFHFSGVIAVVMAGLFVGNYGSVTAMSPRTNYAVASTWEFAGFAANSLIFLLIGLALETETLLGNWWVVLVAFVATLLGRAASVYALSPLLRGSLRVPRPYRHVMVWGGLRGALSLALVLSLPFSVANGAPFPERSLLLAMTFGVVGTSLLLQGLTMAPLLRRLGLATEHEVDEYESLQGRLSAAEAAMHSLAGEHDRGELGEVQYERLRAAYIREQERLRRRLAELRAPADERDRQRERAATRRAALAERAAVQELYRRGAISEETLQSLDEEIEDRLASVEDAPGESA